jgi:hypothetical protein
LSPLAFFVVWQKPDAAIERDVLAFWRESKLVAEDADAASRLRNLCVVARDGGRIVGVLEAEMKMMNAVGDRFAMLKPTIAPEYRETAVPTQIQALGFVEMELWSAVHPEEKAMGIAAVAESRDNIRQLRDPAWPPVQYGIVNHTRKGEQVRIGWFKGARID